MSLRVAVLVSGEGSNLQAILDQVHGRDGVEVVAVGSNRAAARGLERAQAAGVATGVFEGVAFADRGARDEALGDWLEQRDVQLVVLAGFMELLGAPFIRRFSGRIINVHPSLLPAFPGVRAIEQALEYGVKQMGVTVHFVDEGVDSGAIILQEAFAVDPPYSRDIAAIEDRIHEIEHRLLPQAVQLFAAGAVSVAPGSSRHVIVDEGPRGDD
ncbi:MAG: phosphoribosylglycinamide formyltransferase 1 [Thermoleophilaceae bacterium]|jgi:phosphoribosylglycinamide formyltransferase-1|nr:phosphoribosylglycinamide formyltransferase 1 [Thermoleophilaceae bacterium]